MEPAGGARDEGEEVTTVSRCSVGLEDHVEAVEKIQQSSKAAAKQVRTQLREIAQLVAFQHLHSDPIDPVACIHRDDGDNEFMNILANQLAPKVQPLDVSLLGYPS